MYCTNCGNQLEDQSNFCSRCGFRVASASQPTATNGIPPKQETRAQKFWNRLCHAVALQLQQEAIANAMQRRTGDNFWSSTTASGNDNGQSGYVDAGGTIVGYDR